MFTQKAVDDETHTRKSTNVYKSNVRIEASQLFSDSMCQLMPTGLYTKYELDADLQRFKPHQNKSKSFAKMVMSYFNLMGPDCKIEKFCTTGTQN